MPITSISVRLERIWAARDAIVLRKALKPLGSLKPRGLRGPLPGSRRSVISMFRSSGRLDRSEVFSDSGLNSTCKTMRPSPLPDSPRHTIPGYASIT